jgi:hypothetical protein
MKNFLLSLIAVACFAFAGNAQDQGEIKFGAGLNLFDISDAVGIQGKAIYGLSEQLDLSGAFTYWLKDGIDWEIDANVQYKGLNVSESFKLQPLAGLTFLQLPSVTVAGVKFGGSTTALHLGASFRFVLESGMTVYAEPIIIIDDGSGINIAGGILF